MNKNYKMYFDSHKGQDSFLFTTDGQAFFTENEAIAHAQKLEKAQKGAGLVVTVTREQVAAWWKAQVPKDVIAAKANLVTAEQAQKDAQEFAANLSKDATPSKRLAANGAVLRAGSEVKRAQEELDEAQAALEELFPDELDEDDDDQNRAGLVGVFGEKLLETLRDVLAASDSTGNPGNTNEAKNEGSQDGVNAEGAKDVVAETNPGPTAADEKKRLAQEALDKAKAAHAAAVAAKSELPEDATPKMKGDATRAINLAQAAVDNAQEALDALTEA